MTWLRAGERRYKRTKETGEARKWTKHEMDRLIINCVFKLTLHSQTALSDQVETTVLMHVVYIELHLAVR